MTAISAQQDEQLLAELGRCETGVWDALIRGDIAADAAALADNFLGVYADGFAVKADHVQSLEHGATMQSYDLSSMRVMALGADHAVLSYRADFLRVGQARPEAMYISSIWQRTAAGWINVFSQDTSAVD
ncbi:MAG: DUF4440 domain-containing protein [bacterium]